MKKYIKYIIILIIIILIPLITKYGTTYAKYAYNSVWNYYLKSKGFYLNSNTLESDAKIVNNLWDGEHIYFDLRNNLNDSIASEYDINYNVTCTIKESNTDASCNILNTNSSTYQGVLSTFKTCKNDSQDGVDVSNLDKTTCEINGYTWENQPAIKELYFDITGTEKVENATVQITVTSTSPFKKTISQEFILNRDKSIKGSINSNYLDKDDTGVLILSNSYSENKCLRINWNSEDLRLDIDTDKVLNEATDTEGYINEIEVKVEPKNSIKFDFYKKTDQIYSKDNFTITELEVCN